MVIELDLMRDFWKWVLSIKFGAWRRNLCGRIDLDRVWD